MILFSNDVTIMDKRTLHGTENYLASVLGIEIGIREWPEAKNLPFFLREGYRFALTEILGTPLLLMCARGEERETPAAIAKKRDRVAEMWGGIVLVILPSLSALDRSRLIAARIAFVVPGRQLYLPPLGIDLRELYPASRAANDRLGPVAQLVLLWAIKKGIRVLPSPSDLARELGYTKMTLGRAFDDLEACGLGVGRREGRTRGLELVAEGRKLWEAAFGYMASPVKRKSVVHREAAASTGAPLSGLSALAEYSSLAAPPRPVYAAFIGKGADDPYRAAQVDEHEDDAVELELWVYDPRCLAEGLMVDRLSLFLSLRSEKDERVSKALDEVLGGRIRSQGNGDAEHY